MALKYAKKLLEVENLPGGLKLAILHALLC